MCVYSNQLGTGTGKTLSFALPVIERFLKSGQLVVCAIYMIICLCVSCNSALLFVNIFSDYVFNSVFVFDDLMFVLGHCGMPAPTDKFHSVQ